MGMFDDVKCEMGLPNRPNWLNSDKTFQTKDLACQMDTYTIQADGTIFGVDGWTKERFTLEDDNCTINFYTDESSGDYSFWVEYKAIIQNGKVKEILCVENRSDVRLSQQEEQEIDLNYPRDQHSQTIIVPNVGECVYDVVSLFTPDSELQEQTIVYKTDEQFCAIDFKGRLQIHENYLCGRNYYVSEEEGREHLAKFAEQCEAYKQAYDAKLQDKKDKLMNGLR